MENIMKISQNIEKTAKITVMDATERYTGSLSYNTRRAYEKDVREFFGIQSLSELTMEQIQSVNVASANQHREKLLAEGKALSTINRALTALSKFYSVLSRKEISIMDYNPFDTKEGTSRMKQNKRYSDTRSLSTEEVRSLVKITMEGSDIVALRNRIIVLLLATTGMRRAELVNIKVKDIVKMYGENVIKITGKGDKERLVKVSGTLMTFITKYITDLELKPEDHLLQRHTSNGYSFSRKGITTQTIYDVVKDIADKAGIGADDVSPHCLRHTFVTEALELGLPLQDVGDMAGHADLSTTRRYDHTRRVIKNNPADQLEQMFLGE